MIYSSTVCFNPLSLERISNNFETIKSNIFIFILCFLALFLLDFHYEVYVWEGWIPENDLESLSGSGKQRWDTDRKLAMETAMKYAEGN